MTKKSVEMLAKQYENLDPEVLEIIIRDQVLDAERKLEQQRKSQAEKFEELKSMTLEELAQRKPYDPRTDDRQDYQLQRQAFIDKLDQRAEVIKLADNAMSQADYNAIVEKRDELVAEAHSLHGQPQTKGGQPTEARLRSQAIAKELEELADKEPSIVLPGKKSEPEPEPPEKEIYSHGGSG